jgi:TIR domain
LQRRAFGSPPGPSVTRRVGVCVGSRVGLLSGLVASSPAPSVFVSYAHEDQEFVLALIEALQAEGLDVRYDQVVLRIGDSLSTRLAEQIKDGDFLLAVVSPDSVESEWCRKELGLAMTQGINARRVKVLPVRFRGVEMPPMLEDTFWGDGDRYDTKALARLLAIAIRELIEGRDDAAAREAQEAEVGDGQPAHEEVAGDVRVAEVEDVAQRAWDVFGVWESVWVGRANVADLADPQRRLRWALDALSDRVRDALPLVRRLAESEWDDYFGDSELINEAEQDIREELRSVRTQVAQGLPVRRRWTISHDLGAGPPRPRDAVSYLWQIDRGEETRVIEVYISRTAMQSANEHLPPEVVRAKDTNGRSVVVTLLGMDDPPEELMVSTTGISHTLPD